MEVFMLEVDYDSVGNSPWGMLRHEAELEDIWPLYRARPLAVTWQPMPVTLHDAEQHAEFFFFSAGGWAVRPEARNALETVVGKAAEFLPLTCDTGEEFFALHPLQLTDLGSGADVSRNVPLGNISYIRRYDFEPGSLDEMVCFRIRHPVRSAAGPEWGGSDVLVLKEVRECIERYGFRGVRCASVFPTDDRWLSRIRRGR